MTKFLSKFGEQQLVVVNYACGFNQSETGKYFEWIIIDFLRNKKQNKEPNWGTAFLLGFMSPPEYPKALLCLFLWLFLVKINDLKLPDESIFTRKYAGDSTISEVILPSQPSQLQLTVDHVNNWSLPTEPLEVQGARYLLQTVVTGFHPCSPKWSELLSDLIR